MHLSKLATVILTEKCAHTYGDMEAFETRNRHLFIKEKIFLDKTSRSSVNISYIAQSLKNW